MIAANFKAMEGKTNEEPKEEETWRGGGGKVGSMDHHPGIFVVILCRITLSTSTAALEAIFGCNSV